MTAPNDSTPSTPVDARHTWAYIALTTLGTILSAFAPKIQASASAHPVATILIGGAASVVGSMLPGATQKAP